MDTQQKLQSYKLLIDVAKKATSTMECDSILQYILDGIVAIFPYVDRGILYIYEDDKDMLRMAATYNFDFDDEYPYLKRGESVSGKVFERRDCIALNGKGAYEGYMDRLSTYFKSYPATGKAYPYSAITCCMMVEDRPVGVVTLYNYNDEDYFFTQDDLELLSAAADHAAITISKAQLIQQKDYYLHQLEESNKNLSSTVEMQSNFTNIILNSTGFTSLLEYLKSIIGGEVFLYDIFSQLIYSTDTENPSISLQSFISESDLGEIMENGCFENMIFHQGDSLIVVNPVIVHTNLTGFLIIFFRNKEFTKKDEAVLNHAVLVIALEWLKGDAKTKSFSDFSNKFLDLVLYSDVDTDVSNYAKKLGLSNEFEYCVTIIKRDTSEDYDDDVIRNLYVKNILNIIKNNGQQGIVFFREEYIYLIYYFKKRNQQVSSDLGQVEDLILGLDPQLRLVRGGLYQGLDKIKRSYYDAGECLKMILDYNIAVRKIDYSSIGIWQLLLKLDKKDLEVFAKSILKNLLMDNSEKNREFFQTLRAYASNNKNIKECAKELDVHLNTIYFRIKKIQEILGIDLENEKDWLNVQLACTILSKCEEYV